MVIIIIIIIIIINQSIRANLVQAKIDKIQKYMICRLSKKADESIDHVGGGFSKLAQKEYKRKA